MLRTVAFLAAFAFTWFQDSNAVTRSLTGFACCVTIVLVIWCIYVSWEINIVPEPTERPLAYKDPLDPCEEVVEEATSPGLEEGIRSMAKNHLNSTLRAIAGFLRFRSPFRPRHRSDDYEVETAARTPAEV